MAQLLSLHDAIEMIVHDGDEVAMEGFSHLIPFAAGHEIIRQGRVDLTLIRLTPDLIFDQMIGMGCARKLVFSWAGSPGVGSLHRFRDAVEHEWPKPLEIEEHTHAGLTARYVAGASGLPFGVLRAYAGTGLAETGRTENIDTVTCPFTGEQLAAVAALHPDVAIIHAQEADFAGNVLLWGIQGVQKEAVLSAKKSIVTVERYVEKLTPRAGSVFIPSWAISAVVCVPGGAQPSYAAGITDRDNEFYLAWDGLSRDREPFLEWMNANVLSASAA